MSVMVETVPKNTGAPELKRTFDITVYLLSKQGKENQKLKFLERDLNYLSNISQ